MRGWWQDLTDLVLPTECGGCGRPRTVLCPECRAALSGAVPRRVRPVPQPPGLPVVHAAARYADEVRAVLLAHKERGALALAAPLGVALAGAVCAGVREAGAWTGDGGRAGLRGADGRAGRDARIGAPDVGAGIGGGGGWGGRPAGSRDGAVWGGGAVVLVPVPSARRTVRARGHDPARRIALAGARALRRAGTPARVAAVLRQRREVADQAGLNSRQRLENLAGALVVVPGGERLLAGGPVVLVDDLMTTGASLAEAARAVREASAGETEGAASGGGVAYGRPVAYGDVVRGRGSAAGGASAWGRGAEAYGGVEEPAGRGGTAGTEGVGLYGGPGAGGSAVACGDTERGGRAGGCGWAVGGPRAGDRGVGVGEVGACRADGGVRECLGLVTPVYGAGSRERREERTIRVTEEETGWAPDRPGTAGGGAVRGVICAAVVAATPDSFEMNRN